MSAPRGSGGGDRKDCTDTLNWSIDWPTVDMNRMALLRVHEKMLARFCWLRSQVGGERGLRKSVALECPVRRRLSGMRPGGERA